MTYQPLKGQKALVTGANSGIGEGVAKSLGAAGAAVVVNYVGLQRDAKFVDMTLEQWNFVLGVNLSGMFLCARAAAREMIRRGIKPDVSRAAGKIICMSSVHELIP